MPEQTREASTVRWELCICGHPRYLHSYNGTDECAASTCKCAMFLTESIVYEGMIDGRLVRQEARLEKTPVPRSRVQRGQQTVEHSSCSYAIYEDNDAGEYVAHPIQEGI